uniref:Nucleoporin NUP188 homolog n=1 Tax=Rhabditophanes sp. KR3021 TaxID=114890 RepID=A0AC35TKA1_9BILA
MTIADECVFVCGAIENDRTMGDICGKISKSFEALYSSKDTPVNFAEENLEHFVLLGSVLNSNYLMKDSKVNEIIQIYYEELRKEWSDPYLNAVLMFAFAPTLKALKQSRCQLSENLISINDGEMMRDAIEGRALHYLRLIIMKAPAFYKHKYGGRVLDKMIKNFIKGYPEIINLLFDVCEKELYNIEYDTAINLDQPKLNFATLLSLLCNLYEEAWEGKDKCLLEFFEEEGSKLYQFLLAGQSITSPQLFVTYLDMLRFFSATPQLAKEVNDLFVNVTIEDTFVDWQKFFVSLGNYKELYGKNRAMVTLNPSFQGRAGYQAVGQPMPPIALKVCEVEGLTSWTRFAEHIANKCPEFRNLVLDSQGWRVVDNICGLLQEDVPIQLKGCLYRFLAALVTDEPSGTILWNYLHKNRAATNEVTLLPFQSDLEQKETVMMSYDASLGFVLLLKKLFCFTPTPTKAIIKPYLRFLTKSIIEEAGDRQYLHIEQMWGLLTTSINCLYELVRNYFVDTQSVINQTSEVSLLAELLNNSRLFKAIAKIIVNSAESCSTGGVEDPYREELSLVSIRLLQAAFALYPSLKTLIRQTNSSVLISSLDSLLLSSLECVPSQCYIFVLISFISTKDQYVKHTFYVMKMLRDLIAIRPSPQERLVQILMARKEELLGIFYSLTSVASEDLELGFNQVPLSDLTDVSTKRIKGEIGRLVIEIFNDSVNSSSKTTNLAFCLLNFDMSHMIAASSLREQAAVDMMATTISPLHGFVDVLNVFADEENPFLAPCASLFEPVSRLFLALASLDTSVSTTFLRFLRGHHNLVHRLAASSGFRCGNEEFDISMVCVHNLIRSNILNLISVEMTVLFKIGTISMPEKYYEALFCGTGKEEDDQSNFLLDLFTKPAIEDELIEEPCLSPFIRPKIEQIYLSSVRESSLGAKQIDLDHLLAQLNNIYHSTYIHGIDQEAIQEIEDILQFGTMKNQLTMVEFSSIGLKESIISAINVVCKNTPNSFMEVGAQARLISDFLLGILTYLLARPESEEVANLLSETVVHVLEAFIKVSPLTLVEEDGSESVVVFIVDYLMEVSKIVDYQAYGGYKENIFTALVLVLSSIRKRLNENGEQESSDSISEFFGSRKSADMVLGHHILQKSSEFVRCVVQDLHNNFAALSNSALSCLNALIAVSYVCAGPIVNDFLVSGCLRTVIDSFNSAEDSEKDWSLRKNTLSFNIRMAFLIRIGTVDSGWNVLTSFNIFEKLIAMPVWTKVPEKFYSQTQTAMVPGTPVWEYLVLLNTTLRFALVMLSNPKWRQTSGQVLKFIIALKPIFNQLIYSKCEHPILFVMRSITDLLAVSDQSIQVPADLVNFIQIGENEEEFEPLKIYTVTKKVPMRL